MTFKDKLTKQYPICIFCGSNASETIDHVPPRTLFDEKHRPKGLEFAACKTCNAATRKDELVVSLLSRVYPDPTNQIQRAEVKKLLRDAERHNPGLMAEIWEPDQDRHHRQYSNYGVHPKAGFLRCNGPIVTNAILRFAAKLGLALHCKLTGSPVSPEGGVAVAWYSNLNAMTGDRMPETLISLLGPGQTLEQGSFRVPNQFRYASRATDDKNMSGHIAVFRESFAIQAVVKNLREEGLLPIRNTFFPVGCFLF